MSMIGKVVIISGGGRDIGRACAIDLAKQGANVVLTYHCSQETAQSAAPHLLLTKYPFAISEFSCVKSRGRVFDFWSGTKIANANVELAKCVHWLINDRSHGLFISLP